LLTVIAKLSRIGNCFRLNWKGNISSFDGHKGMRDRKTRFPACCPNTISASMVFFWNISQMFSWEGNISNVVINMELCNSFCP
jgi:hypothetical protein